MSLKVGSSCLEPREEGLLSFLVLNRVNLTWYLVPIVPGLWGLNQ